MKLKLGIVPSRGLRSSEASNYPYFVNGFRCRSLARMLKQNNPSPRIPGYYPHVRTDLQRKEENAGVDHVVPNSSFLKNHQGNSGKELDPAMSWIIHELWQNLDDRRAEYESSLNEGNSRDMLRSTGTRDLSILVHREVKRFETVTDRDLMEAFRQLNPVSIDKTGFRMKDTR